MIQDKCGLPQILLIPVRDGTFDIGERGLYLFDQFLAGSLGLSCIRTQLTAAILLLGPRSDGNRRRNFPCLAFSLTCYA